MRISLSLACVLAAAGAARADTTAEVAPRPTEVAANKPAPKAATAGTPQHADLEQASMTELPAIGNDPAVRVAVRGTPASLPPVTAQIFRIGGRTEAEPFFQFSVGDPFYRTWLVGVRIEHHLDERWSFAVHALGGASSVAAPIDLCGGAACDAPTAARLRSTPGNVQMMTGIEASWAPLYGKLSLFGDKTIHFDAYVALGPEILRETIAPDAATAVSGRFALGGRASIGERVFFSDNFMIRFGASEVVYGSPVRGRTELERKLSIEGGVAWLFGATR
jgi:outer membrane beta-barrel protein